MTEGGQRDAGILKKLGDRTRSHPDFSTWFAAWWRWLWTGARVAPRPAYRGLYEQPTDADRTGVCCSGGGIRSAAFNLGALQALQQHGVLAKTHYLSAVSGGSYIASALTMVAKSGDGAGGLDPKTFNDQTGMPFAPGTPEEQYLRNHLSYLAPDASAKVYLGLRLTTGLLVNVLLVCLPVLIAGLVIGLTLDGPYRGIGDGSISVPHGVLYPVLVVALLAALAAALDVLCRPRKDSWRRATETWEVRFFVLAATAAVALIAVPWLAAHASHLFEAKHPHATAAHGVRVSFLSAAGSIAALASAAIAHVRGIVKDHEKLVQGAERKLGRYVKTVRDGLIAIVVTLAGPVLVIAIATFGVLLSVESTDKGASLLAGAAGLLLAMLIFVDLTTVSLHPFYRRRLAAAFALARSDDGLTAHERPFDTLVDVSKTDVGPGWPMLIVCAAANISEPGATPPGRRVASFTFSPTAIGGPLTGATDTIHYEQLGRNRRRDVTLPAAVAMSGAAVSPSMGKLTYRPLTFLLALANIRLGVWVTNPRYINENVVESGSKLAPSGIRLPRRADEHRVSLRHRPRPWYLWKEILGRNRLDDKYLYITDGGHYENLGLVELLRRGCRTIYCFDAGATDSALGDAIALARTELDVEISMSDDASKLQEDDTTHRSELVCARGTIVYPAGGTASPVTGELFYVRSVVSEKSPWELRNYQLEDGIFPHHSTFDQFFTDQRFEAYRRLGTFAAESALEMQAPAEATRTVTAMIVKAETYS